MWILFEFTSWFCVSWKESVGFSPLNHCNENYRHLLYRQLLHSFHREVEQVIMVNGWYLYKRVISLKHFDNSKEVFTYNPFFVKRTKIAIVITFITKTYFMFGFLTHRFISFATHVKFIIYHVCCNFRLLLQKI